MTAPERTRSANMADRIAADRPDAVALVSAGVGGRSLTFAQTEAAIQARAADLAERVRPGDPVGILAENSPEWLVAFYAIQRAGAVAVPISTKLPPEAVADLADVSALRLLLIDQRDGVGARLAPASAAVADLAAPVPPAQFRTAPVAPEDDAMVLFTSGSTGLPKGVRLSHHSHAWVADQLAVPAAPGQARVLIAAPLYHMNALSNSQRALLAGATTVILPRFEPETFLQAIANHRITRLSGVAPMFELLLRLPEASRTGYDLTSVQEIYLGSAPAATSLFGRLRQVFPGAVIKHGFGTTESGPVVFGPHPDGRPTPDGSVGVPHRAVQVRLVDTEGRPAGDAGILEVRSPALMTGYHHRPDLTPPITCDGFHHTGDVFEIRDGFYFFAGREDDMFVSGGENIYPRAVEQVLESHPAVREAVVVGVPDEVKGYKPAAFVTLRPGRTAAEAELKAHVLSRLEPYAHPRRVHVLPELPLTGANKADRALLTRLAAQRS
ncbi:MAG TPA: acyl--CoA ligase [Candidatus Ruania gallistercoris]|uniref:Acyl--CoA ligase n=1 Tax=Candidatus Ruania gallistercoris TaxID=2838746 RepID=A0A9D2J5W4_9MICO|nr:acyl--CoA ligase [Candidatus Ruania gallistercoris]